MALPTLIRIGFYLHSDSGIPGKIPGEDSHLSLSKFRQGEIFGSTELDLKMPIPVDKQTWAHPLLG